MTNDLIKHLEENRDKNFPKILDCWKNTDKYVIKSLINNQKPFFIDISKDKFTIEE